MSISLKQAMERENNEERSSYVTDNSINFWYSSGSMITFSRQNKKGYYYIEDSSEPVIIEGY